MESSPASPAPPHPLVVRGIICGGALLLPRVIPGLGWWPGYLLVPLLVTVVLSSAVPSWRGPWPWWQLGPRLRIAVPCALVVALMSSVALFLFDAAMPEKVSSLTAHFPPGVFRFAFVAGVIFSLLNAFLEEALYRGILHDAIDAAAGRAWAVALTALAFGLAHYYGFPSGVVGVAMACLYGLTMSGLRLLSGGLFLPILTHACADGTLWFLLVNQLFDD